MKKDTLFSNTATAPRKFKFNQDVVDVFDDMIERSVPFYKSFQDAIYQMTKHFINDGALCYDLGCSTGTTMRLLLPLLNHHRASLIGIDKSQEMLQRCIDNGLSDDPCITLMNKDLNEPLTWKPMQICFLILTLQFLKPDRRSSLINEIYTNLHPGGSLIIIEKTRPETNRFQNLFSTLHTRFKKEKGYTKLEISQKKKALQKILTPYTDKENITMLKKSGFKEVDIFYKWFEFTGYCCIK